MEKIWVVELQCNKETWFPASHNGQVLAYCDFYSAHRERKLYYRYLKRIAPRVWTWKRIRVRPWNSPAAQGETGKN